MKQYKNKDVETLEKQYKFERNADLIKRDLEIAYLAGRVDGLKEAIKINKE